MIGRFTRSNKKYAEELLDAQAHAGMLEIDELRLYGRAIGEIYAFGEDGVDKETKRLALMATAFDRDHFDETRRKVEHQE